ncbi:MAG: FIST C-terminal domain-containing protein [Oscillospiraceae bacterium]|jgi:hypothetical protein|nr:FIST C-terminal domain-containing protein [Oscillospiraceae bacterium]
MRAQTGVSINAKSAEAGADAARRARQGLSGIKLAFVYSGVQYDQKELLAAISEELPDVPLIGNTSFTGVMTQEGFITGADGFVGILALSDDNLTVGSACLAKDGDARATGRLVAYAALAAAGKSVSNKIEPPDYFYMTAPPGEEELYLKGIFDVIGRVPVFGGSAADNAIAGDWLLYSDQTVTADGVGVAFFYTDKPIANVFTGAYKESANVGIVTKLDGPRTLVEIDGVPALKKYAEWTNQNADDLKGDKLLFASITAPIGVKDPLGELVAIRHPMNGNDDYSIAVGANLAVNTAVIQMECSDSELITATGAAITALTEKLGTKPAAFHLVHCGGRRAGIGDRIGVVYKSIRNAADDIPFIVEFTFGEYGTEDDGRNTTGGLMLSFTAFA